MSALAELIERVEKVTGSDREIDGLLYGHLKGLHRNDGTFEIGNKFQFEHPTLRHQNGPAALYVKEADVPEYTASLDAVVALVIAHADKMPIGWFGIDIGDCTRPSFSLYSRAHLETGRSQLSWAEAPTPALALLLAFLRAKELQ